MTIEFWRRRRTKTNAVKAPKPPRTRRPTLPIRVGQAQQKLSQAIICGDHELASWLDLAAKRDLVIGSPDAVKEFRERLNTVMEPVPA